MRKFVDYREVDFIEPAKKRGYEVANLVVGDYQYGNEPNLKSNIVVERKSDDFFEFKRLFAQVSEIQDSGMIGYVVTSKSETHYRNVLVAANRSLKILHALKVSLKKRNCPVMFSFGVSDFFLQLEVIWNKETDGKNRSNDSDTFRKHVSKEDIEKRVLSSFRGLSLEFVNRVMENEIGIEKGNQIMRGLGIGFSLPYFYESLDEMTLYALGISGKQTAMDIILRIFEGENKFNEIEKDEDGDDNDN